MEAKKSFMLYFDMDTALSALSDQQRGILLSVLFEYAAGDGGPGERTLSRYAELEPEARMAFLFIAKTIHRDTEKWRQKQERYQQAAQKRLWAAQEDLL